MEQGMTPHSGSFDRISEYLQHHAGRIILGAVALTLLLVVPLLAMSPDEDASVEPADEVFDLLDDIDERLQPRIYRNSYIVEASSGDVLTPGPLLQLYQNTREFRAADERGKLAPEGLPVQPYLYRFFDLNTNRPVVGVTTLADEVQQAFLASGGTLASATDEQVKVVVHELFSRPESSELKDTLSVKARSEKRVIGGRDIDYWTSPALVFRVLGDNERLGGGPVAARGLGGDEVELDKEEFNRNVQRILRGDERTYHLWGIAIDDQLEAEDEGKTAAVFIVLTVVAAIAVMGVSLRSYWAMALTGAGLGALMIWLKGISNLVGLKGGLIIELILPIAMIALGVDFAVHALGRYQEEKRAGYLPRQVLRVGLAGVLGALVLAMLSDSIAFLSNTSSEIETVIHFGIAAGIAAASSFVVLGVVVPLAMMRIDQLRGPRSSSGAGRIWTLVGGANVAAASGGGVILLIAVSAVAGIIVLLASTLGLLVVPLLIMRWRGSRREFQDEFRTLQSTIPREAAKTSWLVPLVAGLGARPRNTVGECLGV